MTLAKIQHEVINPKDPWARDKLERKKVADYLTPVLASIRQPFVISLHSPYGTGKSFFLECWKADLEQQGYKVVLFDAWKTDFSHDPLSAFIASLKKQTETEGDEIKQRWLELAKRTGGFMRSKALPLLLKGLGRKIVGDDGVKEVVEDFSLETEEVANVLSSAAVEALSAQEAAEQSMEDFRAYLAETATTLVEEIDDEDKKKLIIFVDELDRCKPSYAIEVLECIKHLFAVKGTVFVLAFDEGQMLESISNTYGLLQSGEGYLRKFVDWKFSLPFPYFKPFADFLYDRFALEDVHVDRETLNIGFAAASDVWELTLREQEQTYAKINLLLRSTPNARKSFLDVIGVVAVLFQKQRAELLGAVESLNNALALLIKFKGDGKFVPEAWDGQFLSWFLYGEGGDELRDAIMYFRREDQENDYDEWKYAVLMKRPITSTGDILRVSGVLLLSLFLIGYMRCVSASWLLPPLGRGKGLRLCLGLHHFLGGL